MKRSLSFSCAMLIMALPALAVTPPHIEPNKADRKSNGRSHFRVSPPEAELSTPTLTRSSGTTVKVKCSFPGQFFPEFDIYNDDVFIKTNDDIWDAMDSYDTYVFEIAPGTYDIATHFRSMKPEFEGWAYLVRENVEISEDITITFSPDDVTERVVMYPLMRDGSEVTLEVVNKDKDDKLKAPQEYNTHNISYDYVLYRKGCKPIGSGWIYQETVKKEGARCPLEVFTNKLSDKYHLTVLTYITTEKERDIECSLTDHEGMETTTFHNYIEGFVKYPYPDFARTPLYLAEGVEEDNSLIQCTYWVDNVQMAGLGSYTPDLYPTMYVACQQPDNVDLKAVVTPCSMQMQKTVLMEEEEDGEITTWKATFEGEMYGLPAWHDGKQWNYINQNHSESGSFAYQVPEEGPVVEYPGLAPYCYTASQLDQPLGNSVPICSLMIMKYNYDVDYVSFYPPAWIGRWGEIRNCDNFLLQTKIKDGTGKTLYDSETAEIKLDYWIDDYFFTPHSPQTLNVEYYNPNILIDGGITGFNRTTFNFDESKEDVYAPTPQMLIFKNVEGKITDRFENGDEGMIEFSAGDFCYNTAGRYYTVEEAEVKVECAPYGSDIWEKIEVEVVPEYFYMPGFGYFYRGSLKDAAAPSSNGWYDLRMTLSDKAGNTTVEHISPAFRIGTGSGIKDIPTVDSDAVWYDLQGHRIAAPGKGICIRVTPAGAEKVIR